MKRNLLLLLATLFAVITYSQNWSAGSDIPLAVRAGNTAGYSSNGDTFMFIVSGRDYNGLITKKNQRYQKSTNTWTMLQDHPTGLLGGATAILKDSLYIIGGLVTTPGTAGKKVYKYSINENAWSQVADYPVNVVDAKAVAYQDSLIYVTGSYSGNTYLYNSHKNTWRAATPILPGGSLSWGGFTVKNDTLVWMCGTIGFLSPNYFNTVRIGVIDQADRSIITWTEGTAFPGQTRTFFDAHPWENGIIMTGGSTDNTFASTSGECYVYNVGTDIWSQMPPKPTPWNTGNSATVQVGDTWSLICSGGFGDAYLSETEIFSTGSPLSISSVTLTKDCSISNFQVSSGRSLTLHLCLPEDGAIDLSLSDINGRIVKKLLAL